MNTSSTSLPPSAEKFECRGGEAGTSRFGWPESASATCATCARKVRLTGIEKRGIRGSASLVRCRKKQATSTSAAPPQGRIDMSQGPAGDEVKNRQHAERAQTHGGNHPMRCHAGQHADD